MSDEHVFEIDWSITGKISISATDRVAAQRRFDAFSKAALAAMGELRSETPETPEEAQASRDFYLRPQPSTHGVTP